jgi:hypothetical protein
MTLFFGLRNRVNFSNKVVAFCGFARITGTAGIEKQPKPPYFLPNECAKIPVFELSLEDSETNALKTGDSIGMLIAYSFVYQPDI